MQVLVESGLGSMSIEAESGKFFVILVDLIFFFWMWGLTFPFAIDIGSYLVIRDSMRPVHLGKFPILMDHMSLEGTGINRLVCRKAARCDLVASYCIALQARFCRFLVVRACGGGVGARVIVQRPLVWFC